MLTSLRVVYGDDRFDLSHLTALTDAALSGSGLGESFMSGPTTPHAFAYELPGQLSHPRRTRRCRPTRSATAASSASAPGSPSP